MRSHDQVVTLRIKRAPFGVLLGYNICIYKKKHYLCARKGFGN